MEKRARARTARGIPQAVQHRLQAEEVAGGGAKSSRSWRLKSCLGTMRPDLMTSSIAALLRMSAVGSALRTTRSAARPGSIEPWVTSMPSARAEFVCWTPLFFSRHANSIPGSLTVVMGLTGTYCGSPAHGLRRSLPGPMTHLQEARQHAHVNSFVAACAWPGRGARRPRRWISARISSGFVSISSCARSLSGSCATPSRSWIASSI